jgi:methionine synthase I (cobalamin-dependent)
VRGEKEYRYVEENPVMQVVKVFPQSEAQGRLSELNRKAVEEARAYLAEVKARLQQQYSASFLAITTSVSLDNDIAGALIRTAEAREEGTDATEAKGCDLITLPTAIDPARVEATFEHGLLKLTVPRAEGAKPTQIPVKVKEPAGAA